MFSSVTHRLEEMCRLPAPEGHAHSTDFKVRGAKWESAGWFGAPAVQCHVCYSHVGPAEGHAAAWAGHGLAFPGQTESEGQSRGWSRGVGMVRVNAQTLPPVRTQGNTAAVFSSSHGLDTVTCWRVPSVKPGGGQCVGLSLSIFLRFWSI